MKNSKFAHTCDGYMGLFIEKFSLALTLHLCLRMLLLVAPDPSQQTVCDYNDFEKKITPSNVRLR